MIIDKFKMFSEALVKIDEKIGFKKFVRYILFFILLVALFNIRAVTKGTIEFISDIAEDIHMEKMRLQDEYMINLTPLLAEFRAEVKADRVMYFEYHNSEENLEGMPFKFFDLMKCMPKYGVPEIPGKVYQNIGASMYSELFSKLRHGAVIICQGAHDSEFRQEYRGVFELINESDHSRQFAIFEVPGVRKPIGFIVVEWMEDDRPLNLSVESVHNFLPRITAISAYARKR